MGETSETRVAVTEAVCTIKSAVSLILKWTTNETFRRQMFETLEVTDTKGFNERFSSQLDRIASKVTARNDATEDIPGSFDKILEDVANIVD